MTLRQILSCCKLAPLHGLPLHQLGARPLSEFIYRNGHDLSEQSHCWNRQWSDKRCGWKCAMGSLLCWSAHRWCRYTSVISESSGISACSHQKHTAAKPICPRDFSGSKCFPQCDMHAYVLATQAYARVCPVSYTHPTWVCKASQLHRSIVPLKLESRSIYNGPSRMSWSRGKLLQAFQNVFSTNTSPLLCSSPFPLAQTYG